MTPYEKKTTIAGLLDGWPASHHCRLGERKYVNIMVRKKDTSEFLAVC
jgi:hypothetical protein